MSVLHSCDEVCDDTLDKHPTSTQLAPVQPKDCGSSVGEQHGDHIAIDIDDPENIHPYDHPPLSDRPLLTPARSDLDNTLFELEYSRQTDITHQVSEVPSHDRVHVYTTL